MTDIPTTATEIADFELDAVHGGTDNQQNRPQRSRGDTTLGDVVVVRELDKSSTKLQE